MWKWRQNLKITHDDSQDKRLCRALIGCEELATKGKSTAAMAEFSMGMTTKVKVEQVMQLLEKHPRNPAGNIYLEHDAPKELSLTRRYSRTLLYIHHQGRRHLQMAADLNV